MENNLRHSLHVILNSAMKEKNEFINKICDMIENKECDCQYNCSTIDLESGKKVTRDRYNCMTSTKCCSDDNCKCNHHHHKHVTHAIIRELEKVTQSINDLNETIKQDRKQQ